LGDGSYWAKTYGGKEEDFARITCETSDYGYIVAGKSDSFDNYEGDDYWYKGDIWIIKLNSNGFIEWQKAYGGLERDEAYSIQQTDDDGYIVAGASRSFDAGYSDYWLLKLSSDCSIEWEKTYGGADNDVAHSVQQTNDGGFVVAGVSSFSI
jgi:hypothetical protein